MALPLYYKYTFFFIAVQKNTEKIHSMTDKILSKETGKSMSLLGIISR